MLTRLQHPNPLTRYDHWCFVRVILSGKYLARSDQYSMQFNTGTPTAQNFYIAREGQAPAVKLAGLLGKLVE
jgi:uncharacterized protein (DUF427 family)